MVANVNVEIRKNFEMGVDSGTATLISDSFKAILITALIFMAQPFGLVCRYEVRKTGEIGDCYALQYDSNVWKKWLTIPSQYDSTTTRYYSGYEDSNPNIHVLNVHQLAIGYWAVPLSIPWIHQEHNADRLAGQIGVLVGGILCIIFCVVSIIAQLGGANAKVDPNCIQESIILKRM